MLLDTINEITYDLKYLEKSHHIHDQQQNYLQNEVRLLYDKFNVLRTKQYQPEKIFTVLKLAHLQHIIQFLPLNKQLQLRLVSKKFNRQIRTCHIELWYNISHLQFYYQELQQISECFIISDETYLLDVNLMSQVKENIQVHLNDIISDNLNSMIEYPTPYTTKLVHVLAQFLYNPQVDRYKYKSPFLLQSKILLKQYTQMMFKSKEIFCQLFNSINIHNHPNFYELVEQVKLMDPPNTTHQNYNLMTQCLNQLLVLVGIKNKEFFCNKVNLQIKIQLLLGQRKKLKKIYKIVDDEVTVSLLEQEIKILIDQK